MIDPNDPDCPRCSQCGEFVSTPGELCAKCGVAEANNQRLLGVAIALSQHIEKLERKEEQPMTTKADSLEKRVKNFALENSYMGEKLLEPAVLAFVQAERKLQREEDVEICKKQVQKARAENGKWTAEGAERCVAAIRAAKE